ncbi:DinB superfamily protein [Chitinophaga jiangningensis]|uniref:DinB superfamily protein n=1 Tax=Chitinophaga jiangningensis TaxID=1419482 RepID=A0A1M7C0Z0_9BACT|nr:DinB family protein [Chitinophaga jiangningensis]SHL60509.1 DinB superfamily protein [Chitinophaga jiangningensis]
MTLLQQTRDAYYWTNKLLDAIPFEHWDTLPDVLETSVSWQAGHLIVSLYYHSVMVITGHQMDILKALPMQKYDQLYTAASPALATGATAPEVLREHLQLIQQKSLAVIALISPEQLTEPLAPGTGTHPIAHMKGEALDWNIKHTMWHCGQLGILKRLINGRMDFGLAPNKKP